MIPILFPDMAFVFYKTNSLLEINLKKWHNCDRKRWHYITGKGGTIATGLSTLPKI